MKLTADTEQAIRDWIEMTDQRATSQVVWHKAIRLLLSALDNARRYVERCQQHNTNLVSRHELELAHAQKQASADGFQSGWHAALQRVCEGDTVAELQQLIPKPQVDEA